MKEGAVIISKKTSKTIRMVLFILNILVVIGLLSLSVIMLYFSSSQHGVIFGHTALLYTYEEDTVEKHSLYIVKTDVENVKTYDEIMFMTVSESWEEVPTVDIVTEVTNGIATLEKNSSLLRLNSNEYIGKVTAKYPWLGEKLFTFTSSQTSLLMYVTFGSGFVILSLVVVLLFAIKMKKDSYSTATNPIKELDDLDELVIENDHQPLTTTDDYNSDDEIVHTLELPDFKLQTLELDTKKITNDTKTYEPLISENISSEEKVENPIPRKTELDMILDEIIRNAQNDFEKKYHQ